MINLSQPDRYILISSSYAGLPMNAGHSADYLYLIISYSYSTIRLTGDEICNCEECEILKNSIYLVSVKQSHRQTKRTAFIKETKGLKKDCRKKCLSESDR